MNTVGPHRRFAVSRRPRKTRSSAERLRVRISPAASSERPPARVSEHRRADPNLADTPMFWLRLQNVSLLASALERLSNPSGPETSRDLLDHLEIPLPS